MIFSHYKHIQTKHNLYFLLGSIKLFFSYYRFIYICIYIFHISYVIFIQISLVVICNISHWLHLTFISKYSARQIRKMYSKKRNFIIIIKIMSCQCNTMLCRIYLYHITSLIKISATTLIIFVSRYNGPKMQWCTYLLCYNGIG